MTIYPTFTSPRTITKADDGCGFAIRPTETLVFPAASEDLRGVVIHIKRVGGAGTATLQGTIDATVNPTLTVNLEARSVVCAGPAGWFFF